MSAPAAAPLLVSLGDPAGIGPEIAVAAWVRLRGAGPAFCVIGDARALEAVAPDVDSFAIRKVETARAANAVFPNALPVLDRPLGASVTPGQPDRAHAGAIVAWIKEAAAAALRGDASGVVTCPIAKSSLADAGEDHPGHTEFLGALTAATPIFGERGPVMMLAGGGLRVALVTIHAPLADIPRLVTREHIVRVGRVLSEALKRDFGVDRPKIGLCGLNPHAGEAGALGREEIETINPAAAELRADGVDIEDAASADALFNEDARARYDGVIAMYHDQGLIPVKTLDFHGGINVTLGLPIVRTSPDHGVAYAIAGQGIARPDSLVAAIRMAADIAARRASAESAR